MEDQWLADYEAAKQTAADTLQLIQARGRQGGGAGGRQGTALRRGSSAP